MKKPLVVLLMAIFAVTSFTACTQNEEPETLPIEEEVTEEAHAEEEETVVEAEEVTNIIPYRDYKIDINYVLVEDCAVREEASASSKQKTYDELSDDAKKHAVEGENAVLKKGTVVTCLEVKDDWMRIPSGWICCRDDSKLYVDIREEYFSRRKDDVDPNYLDEIDVVAGSKYVWPEDQNVYMVFNDDGTVIHSDRSLVSGEYDVWKSKYIVEDGVVWTYSPSGGVYSGWLIEDNTLDAGREWIYVKE